MHAVTVKVIIIRAWKYVLCNLVEFFLSRLAFRLGLRRVSFKPGGIATASPLPFFSVDAGISGVFPFQRTLLF